MGKTKQNEYKYKGKVVMSFAAGYNKSFEQFRKDFEGNHIFSNMHPDVREEELKKAHNIAIDGNLKGFSEKGDRTKP